MKDSNSSTVSDMGAEVNVEMRQNAINPLHHETGFPRFRPGRSLPLRCLSSGSTYSLSFGFRPSTALHYFLLLAWL